MMGCLLGFVGFGVLIFIVVALWQVNTWLGVAALVLAILYVAYAVSRESEPAKPPSPAGPGPKVEVAKPEPQHYPTAPTLPVLDTKRTQLQCLEIVGEYYRQDAFHRLIAASMLDYSEDRYTVRGACLLSDDSSNPHDSNAIAVWFGGEHIGYLNRADARRYKPVIDRATHLGYTLSASCYIWVGVRSGFNPRVDIWLPEPGHALPANDIPSDAVFLPTGTKIQVTKEEDHMDVLTKWTRKGKTAVPVMFTLKAIQDVRSRSVVDIVQVCVGDEPIGVLTKGMSEKIAPLVEYVEERAKTPVVSGEITGNSIKCEATLWCARANDVSEDWLQSLGPKKVRVRHERPEPMWDDDLDNQPPYA